jgi:hypothetical protein
MRTNVSDKPDTSIFYDEYTLKKETAYSSYTLAPPTKQHRARGRDIDQADDRQFPSTEACVRTQTRPCGKYDGQRGTGGWGFSEYFGFSCQ